MPVEKQYSPEFRVRIGGTDVPRPLRGSMTSVSFTTGLEGADRVEVGDNWTASLAPADLVLSPAACYPVYPLVASRGPHSAQWIAVRCCLRLFSA